MNFPGYPIGTQKRLMRPEGRGTSRVLAVGEALGENEEKDGLPFRPWASAGSLLERALYRAGVPRDSLTLTNLVWYRPPNNWLAGAPWEMDAIRMCAPMNEALVEKVQPKCILALGGLAYRELTGLSGKKAGITICRGLLTEGIWFPGIPVVGTYHPEFLRKGSKDRQKNEPKAKTEAAGGGTQGMALMGALIQDIQLARWVAANGAPKLEYDDYKLGATLDDWQQAIGYLNANSALPISYDFETRSSMMTRARRSIRFLSPRNSRSRGGRARRL